MKNPFEIITYWLSQQGLTAPEKRQMRQALVEYAENHPARTRILSPYVFRFATVAVATLIIILGGSVGVTSASMKALPNQSLYPLKLWIEEIRSDHQTDTAAQIAFETKRIEERFEEAAKLASTQSLDEATAGIIESGLAHSQSKIKLLASNLETTEPALALEATNNLETTLSSSGKLLARIEQTSGQNVRPIVLAAEVSTKKLALEKISLEKLVALQPNEVTKETVLQRFDELKKIIIIPDQVDGGTSAEPSNALAMTMVVEEQNPLVLLMLDVQEKINHEQYSEALVIIKKIDQMLQEAARTEKLEKEYDIPVTNIIPEPLEPTPVPVLQPIKQIPPVETLEKLPVSEKPLPRKTV